MSGVQVDVNANTTQANRELAKLNRSLGNIEATTSKTSKAMSSLAKSIVVAAGSFVATGYFKNVSDGFTNMSNRVRLVTGDTNDLIKAQNELIKISQRTRVTFESSTEVFNKFGRALKGTGVPVDKILKVTESIQQAVVISGASVESANSALLQLGQGLAAGQLRGQELNSVMEQTPRIAQAIAASLGVGIGDLRKLAEQGALTTTVVFDALQKRAGVIAGEFEGMNATIAQSFLVLSQSTKVFTGGFLKGLGSDNLAANFALSLAKSIDKASEDITIRTALFVSKFKAIVSDIRLIADPLARVFKQIGITILEALPAPKLVSTLARDMKKAIISYLGPIVTVFRSAQNSMVSFFESMDVFNIRPVLGALYDLADIDFSFSRETLTAYSKGLDKLASAIKFNREDSIFVSIAQGMVHAEQGARSLGRYLGVFEDTFLIFRAEQAVPFFRLFEEFGQIIPRIVREVKTLKFTMLELLGDFGPGLTKLLGVDEAIKGLFAVADLVNKSVAFLAAPFVSLLNEKASTTVEMMSSLEKLSGSFANNIGKSFAKLGDSGDIFGLTKAYKVIDAFMGKFSELTGLLESDSWWTDTIESVVSTSNALWGMVASGFRRFQNGVTGAFRHLFNAFRSLGEAVTSLYENIFEGDQLIGKFLIFGLIGAALLGTGTILAFGAAFLAVKVYLGYAGDATDKLVEGFESLGLAATSILGIFKPLLDTFKSVKEMSVEGLSDAADYIEDFSDDVISFFENIYDKVIGNSWWTDTIDNVIETSRSLANKTRAGLTDFTKKTIGYFKEIKEEAKSLTAYKISFDLVSDFKASDLFGDVLSFNTLGDTFGERMIVLMNTFKEEFPNVFKSALLALAGLAVTILFPAGKIKTAILTGLTGAFIATSTLIADAFGTVRLNSGLFAELSLRFGQVAAEFINSIVRNLPNIVSALIDTVGGLARGVLTNLIGVGGIFKALFDVADVAGVGNPLGIFFGYLFGKSILPILSATKYGKAAISAFLAVTNSALAARIIAGGGWIYKFIFGSSKGVLIGAIGLFASFTGILESLVSNSLIRFLLEDGFFVMLLFGNKGLAKVLGIFPFLKKSILDFSRTAFFALTNALPSGAGGLLYGMFYGAKGSNGSFLRGIRDLASKVGDLFSFGAIARGTSGSLLLNAIVGNFKDMLVITETFVTSLRLKLLDFGRFVALTFSRIATVSGAAFTFAGASAKIDSILGSFNKLETKVLAFASRIFGVIGAGGFIGRFLFGKVGIGIAIAALGLLFSSSSEAAGQSVKQLEDMEERVNSADLSVTSFTENLKNLGVSETLTDNMGLLATVTIPLMILGIQKFAKASLLAAKNVYKARTANSRVRKDGRDNAKKAAGGLAAATTFASTGDIFTAAATFAAAEYAFGLLFDRIGKAAQAKLALWGTRLVAGVIAFFSSVPVLIGLAITAVVVGGIGLFDLVFGDEKSWFESMRKRIDSIKEFFGVVEKKKTPGERRFGSIIEDNANDVQEDGSGIKLDFSNRLQQINTSLLSERQIDLLSKSFEHYNDMLGRVIEEQEDFGKTTDKTAENVREFGRQMDKQLSRAALETGRNVAEMRKDINSLNEFPEEDVGFFRGIANSIGQAANDVEFNTTKFLIGLAGDAKSKKNLAELIALRKDYFNVQRAKPTENVLNMQSALDEAGELNVFGSFDKLDQDAVIQFKALERKLIVASEEVFGDKDLHDSLRSGIYATDILNAPEKLRWLARFRSDYAASLNELIEEKKSIDSVLENDAIFAGLQDALKGTDIQIDKNLFQSFLPHARRELLEISEEIDKAVDDYENAGIYERMFGGEKAKLDTLTIKFNAISAINGKDVSLDTFNAAVDFADQLDLDIDKSIFLNVNSNELSVAKDKLQELVLFSENLKAENSGTLSKSKTVLFLNDLGIPYGNIPKAALDGDRKALLKILDDQKEKIKKYLLGRPSVEGSEALRAMSGFDFSSATLGNVLERDISKLQGVITRGIEARNNFTKASAGKDLGATIKAAKVVLGVELEFNDLTKPAKKAADIISGISGLIGNDDLLLRVTDPNDLANLITIESKIASLEEKYANKDALGLKPEKIREYLKELDRLKEKAEDIGDKLATPEETFKRIKQALPDLTVTFRDYLRLSDTAKDRLKSDTSEILDSQEVFKGKTFATSEELIKYLDNVVTKTREAQSELDGNSSFKRAFTVVEDVFDVTKEQFAGFSKTFQDKLVKRAGAVSTKEGVLDSTTGSSRNHTGALYASIEELKKAGQATIDATLGFADGIVASLDKVGVTVSKEAAERLTQSNKETLLDMRDKMKGALKTLDSSGVSESARIAARRLYGQTKEDLEAALALFTLTREETQVYKAGQDFAQTMIGSLKDGLKSVLKGDKSVGDYFGDIMSTYADKVLDTSVDGIFSALTKKGGVLDGLFESLGSRQFETFSKLFGGSDEPSYATETNRLLTSIERILAASTGIASSSPVPGILGSGGEDSSGGIFGGVFDTVSGYASDGFDYVSGFFNNESPNSPNISDVFGEKSPVVNKSITDMSSTFGSDFDKFGTVIGKDFTGGMSSLEGVTDSGLKDLSQISSSGFASIAGSIGAMVGGAIGGTGGAVAGALISALPLLLLADGGFVRGPGTSTSDSIPAMLSDEEFVINANATKKNRRLLEFLNNGGSFKDAAKFAEGGIVSSKSLPMPTKIDISKDRRESKEKTVQEFNINITGDVSRQTRSEIQKMIPQIANGVNGFNNELGNRR
jgi:tape measure domain-containing protein